MKRFRLWRTRARAVLAVLKGWKIYLVAVLLALPDVLSAVVGFDWAQVLPAGYEGYGAKIGAGLGLLRLISIPVMKNIRDAAREGARDAGRGPAEGPR